MRTADVAPLATHPSRLPPLPYPPVLDPVLDPEVVVVVVVDDEGIVGVVEAADAMVDGGAVRSPDDVECRVAAAPPPTAVVAVAVAVEEERAVEHTSALRRDSRVCNCDDGDTGHEAGVSVLRGGQAGRKGVCMRVCVSVCLDVSVSVCLRMVVSVCLSLSLSLSLSLCLSVSLSVCLSVFLSFCLSLCHFLPLPSLLPLPPHIGRRGASPPTPAQVRAASPQSPSPIPAAVTVARNARTQARTHARV